MSDENDGRTHEIPILNVTLPTTASLEPSSPQSDGSMWSVASSPAGSAMKRPMAILENYGFDLTVKIDENHLPKPVLIDDLESPRAESPSGENEHILINEHNTIDPDSVARLKETSPLLPLSIPASDIRKLAIIMVGLPARGKSFIARHVARYMAWRGHSTRIFNVGNYRRVMYGSDKPHTFFDPKNPEAAAARKMCARKALEDMTQWLTSEGDSIQIAIYDATNSTKERRAWLKKACDELGVRSMFIESVCRDHRIVDANVRATKIFSPDYVGKDPEQAISDFLHRIKWYEESYEEIEEDDTSYVKIIDVGKKVVVNNVYGYLPTRVVFFCMNMRVSARPIYITRHGQSEYNALGKIGGNSGLTELGKQYAQNLSKFLHDDILRSHPHLSIWTSTLRRTIQTAKAIGRPFLQWGSLDEIEAGEANGMTYEEMAQKLPHDFEERKRNKLCYRYPRGESYQDLILRLDPVVMELQRQEHAVLVVAHQVRALETYAFSPFPLQHVFFFFFFSYQNGKKIQLFDL
eukprot:TRINITY_DN2277_c0_g1_i1.p1 TRINITY_DN2277_c0_g1~~TRINITY_DN2277_c0_g1_i1.p1  ORF type:complete len:522 (+),score=108.55 TRINITY_DN2277_c0_g1_i1:46-1611(+)